MMPISAKAVLLEPQANQIDDRIDLWYERLSKERMVTAKQVLKLLLKMLKGVSGIVLVPNLSLAFQKKE